MRLHHTVQQAAKNSNLRVLKLVNRLRHEVGQDAFSEDGESGFTIKYDQPDWYNESKVTKHLDAHPMLDAGEMPVHQAMAD